MRHLILITPHFPPTNAADHQRVRMALPYWNPQEWDIDVLAVDPRDVLPASDPFLNQTLPEKLRVTRVRANVGSAARLPGMRSLGYRATRPLRRALEKTLRSIPEQDSCLIYFSTTQFPVHRMIPYIRKKYPVRVVLDLQDPWANDYYSKNPTITPPGGRFRFWIANQLAKWDERRVLPFVDALTTVSSAYAEDLKKRIPKLADLPVLTVPFGAPERDFATILASSRSQSFFEKNDGDLHWVYVGRGGADMRRALVPFFNALKEHQDRRVTTPRILLHFIGTDYVSGANAVKTIAPIAQKAGLGDVVFEQTERIPYSDALCCLRDADALIVPGSDDPRYTASKLFPYILARKPMLAILREESPASHDLKRCAGATLVTFAEKDSENTIRRNIYAKWFENQSYNKVTPCIEAEFTPHTARGMADKLESFFTKIISQTS